MAGQPLAALFCVVLAVVRSQPYPRFEFQTNTYVNNSFIFRGNIGEGADALNCTTDYANCCTNPDAGNWTDERGGAVHQGASGATTIYVTRGDGVVSYNRITGGSSGMWRCDIPDSSGMMQSIYIYTGTGVPASGQLTSASISFTALHTEPNVSPPEFTLTCRSEGGPVTTVSWQRNGATVEEDSNHETSQIIVDTAANTIYENRLRVRGRERGPYRCTVENKSDGIIRSAFFTTDVAGEPTNLAAVQQSDTSIEVSWDSPGSPATGYVIYYKPEGGAVSSVTISQESTESHLLEGLQSEVTYNISIVAVSDHLPSAVVGPVSATTNSLNPPQVTVRSSGSATAGSSYTLTCTVTLPTGVVVTPDVQWEGPGLSRDTTGTVTGSGGTYTSGLSLNPLSPSHEGVYTCTATYTVGGQNSPEGSDTFTITVILSAPTVAVEDSGSATVGSSYSLTCTVTLPTGVAVTPDVQWEGPGLSGDTTGTVTGSGVTYTKELLLNPLSPSHRGDYTCTATYTVDGQTSPEGRDTITVTVMTPSLVVQTSPSSIRILNVPPYNQFTVTCTASAEVNGQRVPLEMTIKWIRRRQPSSGDALFNDIPSTNYETTGSLEDGYQSILNTTETDTESTSYRCRATPPVEGISHETSEVALEVVGPRYPVTPRAIPVTDIQRSSVTIQWIVSSIAYTPETYVVEYGTSQDNLDLASYPQHSGPDITKSNTRYSVVLSGLKAGTDYYYAVVAYNSDDRATSSSIMEFHTLELGMPPGPVSSISVESVSNSSLSISWEAAIPANGDITHYLVWVNSSSQHYQRTITAPEMTVIVEGLVPGVPYKVSVAAVNSAGRGVWNTTSHAVFSMDLKPRAPQDTQATAMNSSSVRVTWSLLTDEDAQGTVLYYIVTYSDGVNTRSINVSADQDYVVLNDLTPGAEYTVRVSARTSAGVGELSTTRVTVQVDSPGDKENSDSGGGGEPVIVGVIVVVIVVLLCTAIVLLVVYVRMRRRKYAGNKEPPQSLSVFTVKGEVMLDVDVVEKQGEKDKTVEEQDADYYEDVASIVPGRNAIPAAEFPEYVRQMEEARDSKFEKEYKSLEKLSQPPFTVAQLPHNISHNRFHNIFPYDQTRVRLQEIPDVKGSDYINASFVDGYNGKKNAFIAAQGPVEMSVERFWRMVWEHQLRNIVMLTRCVEAGRGKCTQYWPENLHDTFTPGEQISVTFSSSLPFAEYEIRKFKVQNLSEPDKHHLKVTQFHYTAWPDHGVPENVMSLINFIRRVRKQHPASLDQPLLVHCSAGVGRTGTFILLDVMMQQMKEEGTFSVHQFIRTMRSQRMKMVQTLSQYIFIHHALSELVVCGETEVAAANLRIATKQLEKQGADGITGFQKHFQTLQELSSHHQARYTEAEADYNKKKNRFRDKLPNDVSRVRLRSGPQPGTNYINASFVNGYKQKGAYIATQGPLQNTIVDFWRMIWEFRCGCIVMLCDLKEDGKESSCCYWPGEVGEAVVYGKLRVKLQLMNTNKSIVMRKMEVVEDISQPGQAKPVNALPVTLMQLTSWPEEKLPHPTAILSLIDHLTNAQMSSSTKRVVVMCSDGVGRTGTFICIHSQLERLKTEGVVDIFQAIKSARIQRKGIIPNAAHYSFCHEVLNTYVDSFETYANFKEVA